MNETDALIIVIFVGTPIMALPFHILAWYNDRVIRRGHRLFALYGPTMLSFTGCRNRGRDMNGAWCRVCYPGVSEEQYDPIWCEARRRVWATGTIWAETEKIEVEMAKIRAEVPP